MSVSKRLSLGILFLAIALPAVAETPQEKGHAIAIEADSRDTGFKDWKGTLRMVLMNRHGETSERELRMRSLEVPAEDEGDKTLIVFDNPRDVKGTALLTFTHILEPDDQWLYLPALKRVKRISSNNKSGPFMGSEFAFEDFSAQEVDKYKYEWLRDEKLGDIDCFVNTRYPQYGNSGYTRQITWVDKEHYRVHKIEFYDRKDALLKTMVLTKYRQYLDRYWRTHDMFMENHQTGKTTRLVWGDYEFQSGLSEKDFSKATLQRMR